MVLIDKAILTLGALGIIVGTLSIGIVLKESWREWNNWRNSKWKE